MNWDGLGDFLHMGGYAVYVWGSYGVLVLCLIGEMVMVKWRRRTLWRRLSRMTDSAMYDSAGGSPSDHQA